MVRQTLFFRSRLFPLFSSLISQFRPQGPKGELELNYPDLVEIKKVKN